MQPALTGGGGRAGGGRGILFPTVTCKTTIMVFPCWKWSLKIHSGLGGVKHRRASQVYVMGLGRAIPSALKMPLQQEKGWGPGGATLL